MNNNPGFVSQETEEKFYENSESFSNEENYVDIIDEPRVYCDPNTEEGQIKVTKAPILEPFSNMSNRQYHSGLIICRDI